jgi:hypothetical protein
MCARRVERTRCTSARMLPGAHWFSYPKSPASIGVLLIVHTPASRMWGSFEYRGTAFSHAIPADGLSAAFHPPAVCRYHGSLPSCHDTTT